MIRLLSLFTGIGAFEKALKNLNIPYELVAFSEIDKYAIKSYCNIHNETEEKNLGDVRNINTDDIPKTVDIMTWGFPCQDIYLAGKLRGIEYGKTRSGLYYGRVGKQISQTILASNNNIATIEKADGTNSSAAVLITEDGESYFKIRRLTQKECWRLMRIFR